ncbi:hypothetical protein V7111_21790 [Neobacillus niacini]
MNQTTKGDFTVTQDIGFASTFDDRRNFVVQLTKKLSKYAGI